MSHLLFPSAIVCSCGKRFDSDWSADARPPSARQARVVDSNGSALWLFLRHRAARLAKRSLTSKPHQAEVVMLQCAYCRKSVDVDCYGEHVRKCRRGNGGLFSRLQQSDSAYLHLQCANDDPSFHCYSCLNNDDESERLDAASLIRHRHSSPSSYEIFMSCRECHGRVPLCDAIGHAAFFHPDRLPSVADLFQAAPSSDSAQIGFCADPSTVSDPAAATFDFSVNDLTDVPISDDGAPTMPIWSDPDAPLTTKRWPFNECDCCGKLLPTAEDLQRHANLHAPPLIHRCRECGKSFALRDGLRKHIQNHHTERRHRCDQCDKRYPTNGGLLQHRRTHTGERPFACAHCERFFSSRSALYMHQALASGIGCERCGVCEKLFYTRQKLEEHRRTHTGERPFTCTTCGMAFARAQSLKTHSTIHISGAAQKSFGCELCGKRFRTKGNVRQHEGSMAHKAKAAKAVSSESVAS